MKTIDITILTPTYNRSKELFVLYNSLKKQINNDFIWFIVVYGSDDNT